MSAFKTGLCSRAESVNGAGSAVASVASWLLGDWEGGGKGAEMGEPGRVRIEGRRPPRGQKLGGTKSKQPPTLKDFEKHLSHSKRPFDGRGKCHD